MTDDSMKPTRRYPVISVDIEALRAATASPDGAFDLDAQIVAVLDAIATSKPMKLRVWGREAADPSPRVYLYLVTPRGSGDLASTLVRALNAASSDEPARVEGSLAPTGGETLFFLVEGRAARSARRG